MLDPFSWRGWRRWVAAIIGFILITLGLLACTALAGRAYTYQKFRKVTVEVYNHTDLEEVFVNCQPLEPIRAATGNKDPAPLDLGWLRPSDFISIAATNAYGRDISFGFIGVANGREIFRPHLGMRASGVTAPLNEVIFARTYTPDGVMIPNTGCHDPDRVRVPGYEQLPAGQPAWPDVSGPSEFEPRHDIYETADQIGRNWFAILGGLSLVGSVLLLTLRQTQRIARSVLIGLAALGIPALLVSWGLQMLVYLVIGMGLLGLFLCGAVLAAPLIRDLTD